MIGQIPNFPMGMKSFGNSSHSQTKMVVKYIQNQEKHHARKTFKDEYLEMLIKFNVEYDKRYVFDWFKGE